MTNITTPVRLPPTPSRHDVHARSGAAPDAGPSSMPRAPAQLGGLTTRPMLLAMSSTPEDGLPTPYDYHRFQALRYIKAREEGASVEEAAEIAGEAAQRYLHGTVDDATQDEINDAGSGTSNFSTLKARVRRVASNVRHRAVDLRDRLPSGATVALA